MLRVSTHKHTVLEVTAIHNSTSESAASAHKTCVKSKCGDYGSWYWLVACGIGLSAYVGLAAEDFCNPVREHGTPGEHGLVSMAVA